VAVAGVATIVVAGGVSFTQFTSINLGGDTNPTWSPDGARVYYVSPSGGFPYVYYKVPGAAANTPGTRMTTWLNDEESVTCSSDGWACLVTTDSLSSVHLYRLPATGGTPLTKMTYGPFEDLHAAWWGTGGSSVVAFASNRGGSGHQIWTLVPNGTLPATQLTPITSAGYEDLFPSWSPDGQSIVFSSNRSGTSQIFVVQRAGAGWGAPVALTSGSTARSNPEYSPSGDWIAYQQLGPGGGSGGSTSLWIMESNGTNPRLVSSSGSYEGEPVWSPDNNELAFVSNRSGGSYIWLAHDLTTPAEPLTWGRVKNRYR
jgi:Tol biopolymer transport system component